MSSAGTNKGAVLITGTSSGIGRATALLLARNGYRVFAGVRKEADAQSLKAETTGQLHPLILDVTKPEHIEQAVVEVGRELGPDTPLHALINNAGVAEAGPMEFIGMERLRKQFDVNTFGHIAMTQAFLPFIRRGPGRVITVISVAADSPIPFLGAYCGSKAATYSLFLGMRRELRWFRIPVSLIMPGFISGPIWDSAERSLELMENEDKPGYYREIVRAMYKFLVPSLKVAASPDVVAHTIQRAVKASWPRSVYRCGPASQMSWLGNWLPERLVHAGLEWQVNQNKKQHKLPPATNSAAEHGT